MGGAQAWGCSLRGQSGSHLLASNCTLGLNWFAVKGFNLNRQIPCNVLDP